MMENVLSHRGSKCTRVQERSFLDKNAELGNKNSPRTEGHTYFPVFQTLVLPVALPWLCFARAPDSPQLSRLWGSHRWGKPDALSLGSWRNTLHLLPLHAQTSQNSSVSFAEKEKRASGGSCQSLLAVKGTNQSIFINSFTHTRFINCRLCVLHRKYIRVWKRNVLLITRATFNLSYFHR